MKMMKMMMMMTMMDDDDGLNLRPSAPAPT